MRMLYFAMIALTLSSCEKDARTIATIVVRNQAGQAVSGATVLLEGRGDGSVENAPRFEISLTTDGAGKASHDFSGDYKNGQAGFAILDVAVSKGSLSGTGLIEVEGQQTTEKMIVIE